jgi:hypothetical protein
VKFFLDHNVPADLAVTLRTLGHEATRLPNAEKAAESLS